jgi:type II secretory pathway pseudopilin PulG
MRPRHGWVFLDVLMGMIIVAILGAILGAAASMNDRAQHHLQDTQAAMRKAESALLTMQSHQKPPVGNSGLSFKNLPDPTNIPGMTWIEVRATVNTRSAGLIGLVPQNTIPAGVK